MKLIVLGNLDDGEGETVIGALVLCSIPEVQSLSPLIGEEVTIAREPSGESKRCADMLREYERAQTGVFCEAEEILELADRMERGE